MIDIDQLEAIAQAAPKGQWEVWTSCSWRRVMTRDMGTVERVIEPTTHPKDKWPDLIFGRGVEAYLEAMHPTVILALLAELRAAREGNRPTIDGDQGSTIFDLRPTDATCTVAGVTLFGPVDNVKAARAALEADPLPTYPDELTPELREALSWLCFQCGPIAHLMRAAGVKVKPIAEDEQAVVLHFFTKHVLRHGAEWKTTAQSELKQLRQSVEASNPESTEVNNG